MKNQANQEPVNQKIIKNSVHLQNFPDVKFFDSEEDLLSSMDLVRDICSTSLAIRDNKNLRVRLPLKNLTVIGKQSSKIKAFTDIIAEEVNVKNVVTKDDFSGLAQVKLQINFKKIGAKYGAKVKEMMAALKENNWQKLSENEIEIAGVRLVGDEFESKLEILNQNKDLGILPLPSNDSLVMLDLELNYDLISEGITRDLVRSIQQNRKDSKLDVSDEINLQIFAENSELKNAIQPFFPYIANQVLAKKIEFIGEIPKTKFCFDILVEDLQLLEHFQVSSSQEKSFVKKLGNSDEVKKSQQIFVGFDV